MKSSKLSTLRYALSGVCIGIADLVPGISGGTMALVLGVWSDLINSLSTFRWYGWKEIFKSITSIQWNVLLPLLIGALLSIFTGAAFITSLMENSDTRNLLFSCFLGLCLGSAVLFLRELEKFSITIFIGTLFAVSVNYLSSHFALLALDNHSLSSFEIIFFFIAGIAAVVALLLPGISGTYVLIVMGVYPKLLFSVLMITKGMVFFEFPLSSFCLVLSFACGVAIGALSFAKKIQSLLLSKKNSVISLLVGFMIGGLFSLWPYWSHALPTLPPSFEMLSFFSILVFSFCFVLGLDYLSKYLTGAMK